MIILDTNIVSEPLKVYGEHSIIKNWLDQQASETLYLTTISLSELLVGIKILPNGKRKKGLDTALKQLLIRLFDSRILSFDQKSAEAYAELIERTRSKGISISVADAQIAAIASVNQCTVATRDTSPFLSAGIPVINPWISKA